MSHKWVGRQVGGSPFNAESYEWVRYCDICGIEDTCEDPLPPCIPECGELCDGENHDLYCPKWKGGVYAKGLIEGMRKMQALVFPYIPDFVKQEVKRRIREASNGRD